MDMNDLLYYGAMKQEQSNDAIESFNTRWQRLCEIQDDLEERFVDVLLAEVSDDESELLDLCVDKALSWQQDINERLDIAEDKHLTEYASHLQKTALTALKLCKKYKVYNDIKSFCYDANERMIKLNDKDLYFLG